LDGCVAQASVFASVSSFAFALSDFAIGAATETTD
jgi:hypothetical protein